ncbi:MAG: DUF4439 domain-containing protein [Dermatophilaceae bacterium]
MPANDSMPSVWSRRSLLVALAAGSVTALSGCGVQLEQGAPRIPLVPTRVPMKDEKALLVVLRRTVSLKALAGAAGGTSTSMAGRLLAIHATQVAVIARLLRDGGVPQSLGAPTPTSTTPTSTRPTATTRPTPPLAPGAVLSAAEGDSVGEVALADLATAHVALIGSMLAQRIASATLLGGTTPPVLLSGPNSAEAVPLLEATRATVYGFEIVAAQIDSNGRALAMSTLASLRGRAADLQTLAGPAVAPPPLGYELPFRVTDSRSARRLGRQLLESLLTAHAAALEPATGQTTALAALVQWLGATEVLATRWGAPLAAFPGLTNG